MGISEKLVRLAARSSVDTDALSYKPPACRHHVGTSPGRLVLGRFGCQAVEDHGTSSKSADQRRFTPTPEKA